MSTLRLYRGDNCFIERFELSKCSNLSLHGKGFYLTDDLGLAKSYGVKGGNYSVAHIRQSDTWHTLTNQYCFNKQEALEEAFKSFTVLYQKKYNLGNTNLQISLVKQEFEDCLCINSITVEKRGAYSLPIKSHVTKDEYERCKNNLGKFNYIVKIKADYFTVGHISEFIFPQKFLEEKIFDIGSPIKEEWFWTSVFERKLPVGIPALTLEEYLKIT